MSLYLRQPQAALRHGPLGGRLNRNCAAGIGIAQGMEGVRVATPKKTLFYVGRTITWPVPRPCRAKMCIPL